MFSNEDFPPLSAVTAAAAASVSIQKDSKVHQQQQQPPPQKVQKTQDSQEKVNSQGQNKTKLNIIRPNNNNKLVLNNNNNNNETSETYISNGLYYSTKTNLPLWPQPAPKPLISSQDTGSIAKTETQTTNGTEAANEKKKKKRKRTRKRNKDPVRVMDNGTFSLNVGRLVVNQVKDTKRRMRIKQMQSLMNAKTTKLPKKITKKTKFTTVTTTSSTASFIENDESIGNAKSLVLIGKYKSTAAIANRELRILVNNHKRNRTKKLTKLKKSIFRSRLESFIEGQQQQHALSEHKNTGRKKGLSESDATLILDKIDKKPLQPKEKCDPTKPLEANESLICKWAMCGEEFPNTKEGLTQFRTHLEEHAKADQEDMMCLWEGCQHPMFVKLRTLRLHAQRHAKLNRPQPPPVWTKDLVKDLKKAPHRESVDLVTVFPQLPSGPEIDECVAALLPPLGLLQSKVKGKKALTPAEIAALARRQRYVIGLREATREVRGGSAKLVILAHKIENVDAPGGPLAQIKKIVQYAQEKSIPAVISHSRKKLSTLLKSQIKKDEHENEGKRKEFNFGVSVIAITSAEGADQHLKRIIELLRLRLSN